jgi:hypothetical protein
MPTHFLPLTPAFVADTRRKNAFHLALSGPFAKPHFRRTLTIRLLSVGAHHWFDLHIKGFAYLFCT